jgi:hypothetical protein
MRRGGNSLMALIQRLSHSSNYGNYAVRGNNKRFHVAPRPGGFYLAYLNDLIERNRRNGKHIPDVADDEYWRQRREDEALKQLPRKAA